MLRMLNMLAVYIEYATLVCVYLCGICDSASVLEITCDLFCWVDQANPD